MPRSSEGFLGYAGFFGVHFLRAGVGGSSGGAGSAGVGIGSTSEDLVSTEAGGGDVTADLGCHFFRSGKGAGGTSVDFAGSGWAISATGVEAGISCADRMDDLGCHFLRSTEDAEGGVGEEIAVVDSGSTAMGGESGDLMGTDFASGAEAGFVSVG